MRLGTVLPKRKVQPQEPKPLEQEKEKANWGLRIALFILVMLIYSFIGAR